MQEFFTEINHFPELAAHCKLDIFDLPKAHVGKNNIKAILLGADPTNDGVKNNRGLQILDKAFGIDSEFENFFFLPQQINLSALNLTKDDLYIQNVCRNYFLAQTSNNNHWVSVARIWLPYLAVELSVLDCKLPILVTAEKIMKLLIPESSNAEEIYKMKCEPNFYSVDLKRMVYPLYRHPKFFLTKNWVEYRTYLKQRINE